MSDIANRDEAMRCLEIARAAIAAGDGARAEKFANKALRLYRCPESEALALRVAEANAWAAGAGGARGGAAGPSTSPRREQQQQQQQQHARGAGGLGAGVEGLRRRAGGAEQPPPEDPSVTPEQRQLVARILASKDYYEILAVSRTADDDGIKRAYRKLALRLHPDKNKAHRAEDAFKSVSRAFSCLSDADKRAHYDRTGYESHGDAAAAARTRGGGGGGGARGGFGGGPFGQMGGMYYSSDDIDPEEIFNMFFGAGAFGAHRAFRTQFGGGPRAQQRRPAGSRQEEAPRSPLLGFIQLLPVLLLVALALFSGASDPVYSLERDTKYSQQLATARLEVPYFVKSVPDFEAKFGRPGSHSRSVLERQVESEHYERTHLRCQQERMTQHRLYTWGSRDKAKGLEMPGCDELAALNDRLGIGRGGGQRAGVAY